MLARLLRLTYLVQLLTGMLLGTWGAVVLMHAWSGAALALVLGGGVGWVVAWQAVIVGFSVLKSRPAGPLWPCLQAFWSEFKAALLIFGLRQPWTKAKPVVLPPLSPPEPGTNALPVLLVHGFVCNHRVWDKAATALRRAGHTVLAIDLEPLFTPIDDYAALVEQAVIELRAQTGVKQVVLVGHSMGGLAIRAWLRAHGSTHAAKIITLGTPHQGTQAPQWLSTPNGTQMMWHSPWLSELAQCESPTVRTLMQLALTRHDNIVYPQRAQVLPDATVTEFSNIGHLAMCLDAEVIRWLVQQAGSAPSPH